MSKVSALVLVADGTEEMEAVITIDVLRRGHFDVTVARVASADKNVVVCSRKVKIVPDCDLADVKDKAFDVVILPGGAPGAKAFSASQDVGVILKSQEAAGKTIAAICASPTALKAHDIAKGKSVTSYPSFKGDLEADYQYKEEPVVVDGKLITSRGPGTAFAFALKIIEEVAGRDVATPLPAQMVLTV